MTSSLAQFMQDRPGSHHERVQTLKRAVGTELSLADRIELLRLFKAWLDNIPGFVIYYNEQIERLQEWVWASAAAGGFFTREGARELTRYLKVMEPTPGRPCSFSRQGFLRMVTLQLLAAETLQAQQQPAMADATA